MKIEAVVVAVNYTDFFCWTALANRGIFDKVVVVTDKKDKRVPTICSHYGYTCVQSDDLFSSDGRFLKFKAINLGLAKIDPNAWVCFLDSDIVLQPITRRVLEELKLDKKCLYGIDRLDCTGLKEWIEYCLNPTLVTDNWLLTQSRFRSFGSRIVHYWGQQGENGKFGGWKPLGFFQLTHRSSFTEYPDDCSGADHCDMVFANQYSRENRVLIPELFGIHLESVGDRWGQNWAGRTSKSFNNLYCHEEPKHGEDDKKY